MCLLILNLINEICSRMYHRQNRSIDLLFSDTFNTAYNGTKNGHDYKKNLNQSYSNYRSTDTTKDSAAQNKMGLKLLINNGGKNIYPFSHGNYREKIKENNINASVKTGSLLRTDMRTDSSLRTDVRTKSKTNGKLHESESFTNKNDAIHETNATSSEQVPKPILSAKDKKVIPEILISDEDHPGDNIAGQKTAADISPLSPSLNEIDQMINNDNAKTKMISEPLVITSASISKLVGTDTRRSVSTGTDVEAGELIGTDTKTSENSTDVMGTTYGHGKINNVHIGCNNDIKNCSGHIVKMEDKESVLNSPNEPVLADKKDQIIKHEWPPLDVSDINTSFKVIGDLPSNTKLKIVNNRHIAAEDSYVSSISRYNAGQSREMVIDFIGHLFRETVRNVNKLLDEITSGINVDDNINSLEGVDFKLAVFLNRFETMRAVYKNDTGVFARLGNLRDDFLNFRKTFFRKVTVR